MKINRLVTWSIAVTVLLGAIYLLLSILKDLSSHGYLRRGKRASSGLEAKVEVVEEHEPLVLIPMDSRQGKRPNFVFILTDEQRADAMRCAGNTLIHTPNIDKLAHNGV